MYLFNKYFKETNILYFFYIFLEFGILNVLHGPSAKWLIDYTKCISLKVSDKNSVADVKIPVSTTTK